MQTLQEEINRLRACESEAIELKRDFRDVQSHLASAEQGIKTLTSQLIDKDSELEELRSKLKIAMKDISHYRQQVQREQENGEIEDFPSKRLHTDNSLNHLLEVSPKL